MKLYCCKLNQNQLTLTVVSELSMDAMLCIRQIRRPSMKNFRRSPVRIRYSVLEYFLCRMRYSRAKISWNTIFLSNSTPRQRIQVRTMKRTICKGGASNSNIIPGKIQLSKNKCLLIFCEGPNLLSETFRLNFIHIYKER